MTTSFPNIKQKSRVLKPAPLRTDTEKN